MNKFTIAILFPLILLLVVSSCSHNKPKHNCNFSSDFDEPERCFSGIGDRCKGIPVLAPFKKNYSSCLVEGHVSVGSAIHDKCCIESENKGRFCAKPDGSMKCANEWKVAKRNSICSLFGANRQWKKTFGPYWAGNDGDKTNQNISAPSGAKIPAEYKHYCKNGCEKKGSDICGGYCMCR